MRHIEGCLVDPSLTSEEAKIREMEHGGGEHREPRIKGSGSEG